MRTNPDEPAVKVVIVCDRMDKTRRRVCRWEARLKEISCVNADTTIISIPELREASNPASLLFDKNKTDVIVLNWNVINGDPVYYADVTLHFFEHYVWDMEEWIRQGGILLVEVQTASSELVQRAYNVFTIRNTHRVQCLRYPQPQRGPTVYFDYSLVNNHPLLQFSPGTLGRHYALQRFSGESVALVNEAYSPTTILSLRRAETHRLGLYNGWFRRLGRGWETLATADRSCVFKKPVLICRIAGDKDRGTAGAIILSTMYLSLRDCLPLIESVLDPHYTCAQYFFKTGKHIRNTRRIRFTMWTLGITITTVTMAVADNITLPIVTGLVSGILTELVKFGYSRYAKPST